MHRHTPSAGLCTPDKISWEAIKRICPDHLRTGDFAKLHDVVDQMMLDSDVVEEIANIDRANVPTICKKFRWPVASETLHPNPKP